MKKIRLLFFSILAFMALSLTLKAQTVVDIIADSDNHQTLEAALIAAELVDTLQGTGPYTVFAPTDEAFAALPAGILDSLLAHPEGDLTSVLLNHVVAASAMSGDLTDGQVIETLLGEELTVTINDEGVFINGAQVTTADIEAGNGVVHVIDAVLMPSADLKIKVTESMGSILTDADGNTLYFFAKDARDTSMCVEGCLNNWPVFYTEDLKAGIGIDTAYIGTIDRGDGVMQTTYKGWPLYYYANDTLPGLMLGEGVIDSWFVARPDYTIMIVENQLTGLDGVNYMGDYTAGDELIQYFTDGMGVTLYTWTNDNYKVNNFTEPDFSNNENWPVYEENHIVVPSILEESDFGVTNVNGRYQLTFKGWPLYYFGQDSMVRGDNKGVSQPTPGVWKVPVAEMEMAPQLETVVDIVTANDDFSSLVAALTREDLTINFVDTLSGNGPFTVFAPTNAAFEALYAELGVASLDEIEAATLEAILQNHVLAARVLSTDLSEGQVAETLLGEELTFSLENGTTVTDPNGRLSNITVVDIEAQNGVVHVIDTVLLSDMRPETVVDIVTEDDNYSTLVEALTREDLETDFIEILSGDGPFTVFAPTNAAFDALFVELGVASLDEISAAVLDSVLKMHVLDSLVLSTDLSDGMTAQTLLEQELRFNITDSATVTDPNGRKSNITAVDLLARNGVVHAIDSVLLYDMRPETVVDIATADDNFSTLVEALNRDDLETDFIEILTGEGPFTVFAPTNAAFDALFVELGVASLEEIAAAVLDSVLRMHVLDGLVLSTDLSEGMTAQTLLEQELTFSIGDSATVTDPNGRRSNITAVDMLAQNGVVHAIDTVLLYDMRPATVVDIVTAEDNFSTLAEALTREDLSTDFIEILTGDGPFTVFAPTNAAFDALFTELGVASLDEIEAATLDSVLRMHVVRGRVMSVDLSEGMTSLTLLGQVITFSLEDGASITDPTGRVSNITDVDLAAQNGVVHAIDTVLLSGMSPETVVDIVVANNEFSTLEAALTREDLTTDFIGLLSGEGPFTVFAPTNAAFEALFEELGVASLDEIDATTLENLLQMHVLSEQVMSADLSEGLTAQTLLNQELTFSLDGGTTITDPNGRVSNITEVDIEAQNGVVHVIDTVILADLSTSIIPDISELSFEFYPNPASNYITVTMKSEESILRIIDLSGRTLLTRKIVQPVQRIDLNEMRSGVYLISMESKNSIVTQRLLINR